MDRVSFGIPAYGLQSNDWWGPLVRQAAELYKQNIELVNLHVTRSMMTDVSRNHIVDDFLKSDVEWLRWIDADNVDKMGGLRRLLDTQRKLVTGLYTKRSEGGEKVAYYSAPQGEYSAVGEHTPGEIIPIDAAGMGGCLVHRSVFEDIQRTHFAFDMNIGGMIVVQEDRIKGDVFDGTVTDDDNMLIDGLYQLRLRQPKRNKPFPFFMLGFGRTEDYGFFEMARNAGHQLWLDTGVEVAHIGEKHYTPALSHHDEMLLMRDRFYGARPL